MSYTNADVLNRARKIAAESAERQGLAEWSCADGHVRLARQQLESEHAPQNLKKIVQNELTIEDTALAAAATHAGLQQRQIHEPVRKTALQHFDASHARVEFGAVSVEHGTIMVSLDRTTGKLGLNGYEHDMGEVSNNLRMAIYASAAAFGAAQTDIEQAQQKIVLAALIDAATQRDGVLSRKVQAAIDRVRS